MDEHLALGLWESEEALRISDFQRWLQRVEKLVGHNLDGDQEIDHYSLDEANDMYDREIAAVVYAQILKGRGTKAAR